MPSFDPVIAALMMDRIAVLRQLSLEEVHALPEISDQVIKVGKYDWSLTEFVQKLPSDEILVVIQASRPSFFGLSSVGTERGVIYSVVGCVRDATAQELIESGG